MKRGPRSTPAGQHRPVMLPEVLEVLSPRPGAVVVDCTVGWAGHALELARPLGPERRPAPVHLARRSAGAGLAGPGGRTGSWTHCRGHRGGPRARPPGTDGRPCPGHSGSHRIAPVAAAPGSRPVEPAPGGPHVS